MKTLTSKQYLLMLESAANNLKNNVKLVNNLNVFPIPDGDNGIKYGIYIHGCISKN